MLRRSWFLVVLASIVLSGACANHDTSRARSPAVRPTPAAERWSCARGIGSDRRVTVSATPVIVHLPACYGSHPTLSYRGVYLLHGAGADATQWLDVGATATEDVLTLRRTIGPAILVMPSVGGATSDERTAALVVHHIVPWIDSTYRTKADRVHRTVGGISRGGAAAIRAATSNPALFGAVGGHSPGMPGPPSVLASRLKPLAGRIWLDVGASDGLRHDVRALADALTIAGVPHRFTISAGGHDRPYWRAHMAKYLEFYAGSSRGA
jgi:enterochelin esterase-like enzyme